MAACVSYWHIEVIRDLNKMKTRLFKCSKCEMTFTSEIRLQRHYTKAHPSKPEHYKQKWYWEN